MKFIRKFYCHTKDPFGLYYKSSPSYLRYTLYDLIQYKKYHKKLPEYITDILKNLID